MIKLDGSNNASQFRAVARVALILSACLFSAQAAAFPSAPYFPLPDGATWTYHVSDGTTETRTVAGIKSFNGARVKIIRDQTGTENYFTNDSSGVGFHGGFFIDPVNGNETDTYNPPFLVLSRDSIIGTQVSGSGSTTAVEAGATLTLSYTSASTPLAIETITVPAGTFASALHARVTVNYSGVMNGTPVNFSKTLDYWLVRGIGSVREVSTDSMSSTATTWELQSSNVPNVVPDVFAFPPKTAQLAGVLVVSDPITVSGLSATAPISIVGGDYQINGGPFRSDLASVINGDQVSVRVLSPSAGVSASATLDIGGVTASFMVTIRRTLADFNGDGRSDILWRNQGAGGTGQNYLFPMNDTAILAGEGYLRAVVDPNWMVAGIGDFDGDGKADILWRNPSTGQNYIYFMDGTTIKPTEGFMRTVPLPWTVAAIGDFDGDGKDDILWRNSVTGENYLFPMNGLSMKATAGYMRTVADQNWRIAGIGDFDGDGKADILWRNTSTGQNYIYFMDGITIKPSEGFIRAVPDLSWQVKAVGDFDGDGKADIVWRNSSSGQNYLYPMDGTTIKPTEGYIRTIADPAWQIAAVGDYDGDGKADLLWRNASSGQNYLFPMDGTTIKPTEGFVRTISDQHWQVLRP